MAEVALGLVGVAVVIPKSCHWLRVGCCNCCKIRLEYLSFFFARVALFGCTLPRIDFPSCAVVVPKVATGSVRLLQKFQLPLVALSGCDPILEPACSLFDAKVYMYLQCAQGCPRSGVDFPNLSWWCMPKVATGSVWTAAKISAAARCCVGCDPILDTIFWHNCILQRAQLPRSGVDWCVWFLHAACCAV